MSLLLNVIRLDFSRLAKVQNSGDERFLAHLIHAFGLDEESDDEEGEEDDYEPGDEPVPLRDALRHVIIGPIPDMRDDDAYSEAMAMIYVGIGADIGDLQVTMSGQRDFLQDVDAALDRRGFPGYATQLAFGGCPIPVPVDTEPALGFIEPSECARFVREYPLHTWSTEPPEIRALITDLGDWCKEAAKLGHGLVCVAR